MRGRLLFAIASCLALSVVACRGHATPEDCEEATEHYLDLVMAEDPSVASLSAAEKRAVREVKRGLKRGEPSHRRVQDRCESVTRAEYKCALAASTAPEWHRCFKTDAEGS